MSSPGYPARWEADVVLRDGTTMHIRPIQPSDADALQLFHTSQSPESTYFRFFAPMERLSQRDLTRFVTVDHSERVALVLVQPDDDGERILAVGRFDRLHPGGDVAEVAFNVSDSAQGRGLGSILLEHLAAAGRELGIGKFVADVLPTNRRMLRVFTDAGYGASHSYADGVIEVSVPIRATEASLAVLAERERRAEALSMSALLDPTGIAVYRHPQADPAIADRLLANLAESAFTGEVIVIDDPGELTGQAPLPSLAAISATPAQVVAAIPALARRGVRAVALLSGDYSAAGETAAGIADQRGLVRALRRHGLRLLGPWSFGVLTGASLGTLNATLAPHPIQPGPVGIFCQSSAAARGILRRAQDRRLGLTSFVSAGRRVDISGNDIMQFWTTDAATSVACLYLESIGNPRKFSRVARTLAASKPVVVAIAGSTGQRRPPGHAVVTSPAPRRVLEQLMSHAGVLLADSVRQQLDWAMLLATQPRPAGPRVAVISNSASQNAVIGELIDAHHLQLAHSVDLPPTVTAPQWRQTLERVREQDWDMAVVAYGPFGTDITTEAATATAEFAVAANRPVAALMVGLRGLDSALSSGTVQVPGYSESADAISALSVAWRHAHNQGRAGTSVEVTNVDRIRARDIVKAELGHVAPGTTVRLSTTAASDLLSAYGLTVWPATRVTSLAQALAAAREIGWPVALKASDEVLRHRADLGGVRLDLSSAAELTDAYSSISERLTDLGRHNIAVDVQAMAPSGAACVVTGTEDSLYGPIISFGLAGDAVDLLDDVAYAIPPLTDTDVAALVRAPRAARRLLGHRGLPPLDIATLEDVITRVGLLKEEIPQVRLVRLNPVLVGSNGAAILSATVELAPTERGDMARRALPSDG